MYGSETEDDSSNSVSALPSLSKPNIPPEIRPRPAVVKQIQPTVIPSKSEEKKESEKTKKTMTTSDLRAMTSSPSPEKITEEEKEEKKEKIKEKDEKKEEKKEKIKEKDEKKEEFEVEGAHFVGIHQFTAENPGDLNVEVGEELTLLATRSDGWWKCQNSRGDVGLVPKNVLQHIPHLAPESDTVQEELYSTINKPSERHPSTVFPDPPDTFVEAQLKKKEKIESSQRSKRSVKEEVQQQVHQGVQQPIQQGVHQGIQQQVHQEVQQAIHQGIQQQVHQEVQQAIHQGVQQPIQQEWKIFEVDKNDHYGLICHLFPRLSESNLHFHDVYWLWNPVENCFKIRKRKVKFCKSIKVHAIGPPEYHQTGLEVRFFLFDKRNITGRQIVSNILTDKIRVDLSDSFNFFKSDYCSFVVRSNYDLPDVVLRAEVRHQGNLLGYSDTTLLSSNKATVQNNKYTNPILTESGEPENKNSKLVVQIQDIPNSLTAATDSLPDVLICRESRIPVYAAYRNLLAENLGTRSTPSSSTWISDPVIATFPVTATDPDLMNLLTEELDQKKGLKSTVLFRQIYIQTILPIIMTTPFPDDRQLKKQFLEIYRENLRKNKSGLDFISATKSKPINPFDYVVDLTSTHALD